MGIETATLMAIGSVLSGGAALYGALSKESGGAPQAPALESPTPMPDAEAQARARRRSITAQLARRGRASTILTSGDTGTDALGGG